MIQPPQVWRAPPSHNSAQVSSLLVCVVCSLCYNIGSRQQQWQWWWQLKHSNNNDNDDDDNGTFMIIIWWWWWWWWCFHLAAHWFSHTLLAMPQNVILSVYCSYLICDPTLIFLNLQVICLEQYLIGHGLIAIPVVHKFQINKEFIPLPISDLTAIESLISVFCIEQSVCRAITILFLLFSQMR